MKCLKAGADIKESRKSRQARRGSSGQQASCPGHIKTKSETVFAEEMYCGAFFRERGLSVESQRKRHRKRQIKDQDGEENGKSGFIF